MFELKYLLNKLGIQLGDGNTKNSPIIVLGMHRSGTSCLTGIMEESGVYLGDVSKSNPFNLKGNHENNDIVTLNDDVLEYNGACWHQSPPNDLIWNKSHRLRRRDILNRFYSGEGQYWGFKDPRTLLTLPFWLEEIGSAHFIGTFRHPLRVASSIHSRDKSFSIDYALKIWEMYNLRLWECYKTKPFPLISFDVSGEEYLSDVESALVSLGLVEASNDKMSFFDENLRHTHKETFNLPKSIQLLYEKLNRAYKEQVI